MSAEEKLDWAQKSFNNIAVGLAKNALVAADRLYKMGYTNLIYLEGEAKMGTVIKKYNGVEAAMHNFSFDNIDLVRLERDPDDPGARGMSATKLRQTVVDNDFDAFQAGITQAAQPYHGDTGVGGSPLPRSEAGRTEWGSGRPRREAVLRPA